MCKSLIQSVPELSSQVTVHLLNGTSAKGDLVYYQPHYDIAFLNVKVDQPFKLPSLREKDVKFAEEVFQLGRDNSLNLRITYARAKYMNPTMFERHHNVYIHSLDGHYYDNEVIYLIMKWYYIHLLQF